MTHGIERPFRSVDLSEALYAVFPVLELAAQVREEESYAKGGKSGLTLLRGRDLTVVLTSLRAGTEIHEHKAPAPATVVVLEGGIRFSVRDAETVHLNAGDTVLFAAGLPHRVLATEDSTFLVVIGGHSPLQP